MSNPIIETDLAQILGEINRKLDNLGNNVSDLKVGQARLEEKANSLNQEIKEVKSSVKTIEAEQKDIASEVADLKGAKSLIIPILVAVTTSILTLIIRSIPIR